MDRAADEYLTIAEVATRLKLKPKTIQNKMAAGLFRQGVHYFRPSGMGVRFKWSAVVAFVEGELTSTSHEPTNEIPMARGYVLGEKI